LKLNINDDPNFVDYLVYCNDKLLDYCIEADDIKGKAKYLVIDENGLIVFDWNDKPITKSIKDKIEFKHI
jgi:hypothetical protein